MGEVLGWSRPTDLAQLPVQMRNLPKKIWTSFIADRLTYTNGHLIPDFPSEKNDQVLRWRHLANLTQSEIYKPAGQVSIINLRGRASWPLVQKLHSARRQ